MRTSAGLVNQGPPLHFIAIVITPAERRAQSRELAVLILLYLLQISNAEMLRRAAGDDIGRTGGTEAGRLVDWSLLLANQVHPVAMVIFGVWLTTIAVLLGRGLPLPRWSFDGPGLWFSIRLLLEFLTINGLVFVGSKVAPGVLLGQIILYLPYFVITWGWIFQRVDLVGRSQPGLVIKLCDADPNKSITSFDYYHTSINNLLSKSKQPTVVGVSRAGRVLVLTYLGMLVALYAVVFTRILQLTRAVV